MIDYSALKSELATDPVPMGYAGQTDTAILILINGTTRTMPRGAVDAQVIVDALNPAEFASMADLQLQEFNMITSTGRVDVGNANVQGQLSRLFTLAAFPITRAAIILLATRPASRAEQLFGTGTTVAGDDLLTARRQ